MMTRRRPCGHRGISGHVQQGNCSDLSSPCPLLAMVLFAPIVFCILARNGHLFCFIFQMMDYKHRNNSSAITCCFSFPPCSDISHVLISEGKLNRRLSVIDMYMLLRYGSRDVCMHGLCPLFQIKKVLPVQELTFDIAYYIFSFMWAMLSFC
jgi:hypothetical protein